MPPLSGQQQQQQCCVRARRRPAGALSWRLRFKGQGWANCGLAFQLRRCTSLLTSSSVAMAMAALRVFFAAARQPSSARIPARARMLLLGAATVSAFPAVSLGASLHLRTRHQSAARGLVETSCDSRILQGMSRAMGSEESGGRPFWDFIVRPVLGRRRRRRLQAQAPAFLRFSTCTCIVAPPSLRSQCNALQVAPPSRCEPKPASLARSTLAHPGPRARCCRRRLSRWQRTRATCQVRRQNQGAGPGRQPAEVCHCPQPAFTQLVRPLQPPPPPPHPPTHHTHTLSTRMLPCLCS